MFNHVCVDMLGVNIYLIQLIHKKRYILIHMLRLLKNSISIKHGIGHLIIDIDKVDLDLFYWCNQQLRRWKHIDNKIY